MVIDVYKRQRDAEWIPEGWMVSDNGRISFSKAGDYITFGTCPIPREKDTTLVEFEQPKLDIWSWNDEYIQPIQLKNLNREKKRTYLAKINIDGTNPVQLADPTLESLSLIHISSALLSENRDAAICQ